MLLLTIELIYSIYQLWFNLEIMEINVCVYNRELFPCHFFFIVYLGIDFSHNPVNNDCHTRLIRHGHIYWASWQKAKGRGNTLCIDLLWFNKADTSAASSIYDTTVFTFDMKEQNTNNSFIFQVLSEVIVSSFVLWTNMYTCSICWSLLHVNANYSGDRICRLVGLVNFHVFLVETYGSKMH